MVKRKMHFKKTHIFPDDIVINILGFLKQNGPMILTYDYKQKKFVDTEHPKYTRAKISVQLNGLWLKDVRNNLQTEEICKLAVQQDGRALLYIRKDLQTYEMCILAVQQYGRTLEYVKKNLQTYEMCILAVQQENGLWLKNVRKKLQTEEMCRLAFLQNSKAIKYVKKKLIKEKLLKSELYKKQPYLFILNSFGIVRYNLKTKKFEETIEFGVWVILFWGVVLVFMCILLQYYCINMRKCND